MLLERILAFAIVLMFFFPLINKVVRLANRAWNEKEYIDEKRFRQVVYITPAVTFFIFIVFYFAVVAILSIIEI